MGFEKRKEFWSFEKRFRETTMNEFSLCTTVLNWPVRKHTRLQVTHSPQCFVVHRDSIWQWFSNLNWLTRSGFFPLKNLLRRSLTSLSDLKTRLILKIRIPAKCNPLQGPSHVTRIETYCETALYVPWNPVDSQLIQTSFFNLDNTVDLQ